MSAPFTSPEYIEYLNQLLTKTPQIAAEAGPVLTEVGAATAPEGVGIPLLVLGGALTVGGIYFAWTNQQQKALQNLAAAKFQGNPNFNGTKNVEIRHRNVFGDFEQGVVHNCGGFPPAGIDATQYLHHFNQDASPPPEIAHAPVFNIISNGELLKTTSDPYWPNGILQPITIISVADSPSPSPQPTNDGSITWDQLQEDNRRSALQNLTPEDIAPILKTMPASRITPGQKFAHPVVFSGNPSSPDKGKQMPFTASNLPDFQPNTITVPGTDGLPNFTMPVPDINPPAPNNVDPFGQTISTPTSPSSGVTFSPRSDGGVDIYTYGTPTAPVTPPRIENPTLQDLHDQLRRLERNQGLIPLATTLAIAPGLTRIRTPEQDREIAGAGTCDAMNPGGCGDSAIKRNLDNFINNIGRKIDAINSAAQDAALATILERLGPQIPGGISGLLQTLKTNFDNFVKWAQPGRVLDMFTFIVALHNAFMLSQALPSTIKQLLIDWLHVLRPNFGKQPDGSEIDINAAIDSDIEFWISKLIGEQKVKKLEEDFKAVNRIYQASTNLLNNMQMLVFSVTMALEIVAQEVSSIGNALKKYKVVGEKAFAWMNPAPNFKNKWIGIVETGTEKINGLIAGLFAIDTIAQGILQGRQAVDQMSKDKEELKKSLFEGYATVVEGKVPEHKESLDTAIKSKGDSKGAPPTEQDIASIQP